MSEEAYRLNSRMAEERSSVVLAQRIRDVGRSASDPPKLTSHTRPSGTEGACPGTGGGVAAARSDELVSDCASSPTPPLYSLRSHPGPMIVPEGILEPDMG